MTDIDTKIVEMAAKVHKEMAAADRYSRTEAMRAVLLAVAPALIATNRGCVCPGDATPYCKNPLCPRKAP